MTVRELIEELKKYDQDANILISIDLSDGNEQEAYPYKVYTNKSGEVVIENY